MPRKVPVSSVCRGLGNLEVVSCWSSKLTYAPHLPGRYTTKRVGAVSPTSVEHGTKTSQIFRPTSTSTPIAVTFPCTGLASEGEHQTQYFLGFRVYVDLRLEAEQIGVCAQLFGFKWRFP